MPIHLEAPTYDSRGPDERGWNRMSIAQHIPAAQCALRPRSYSHMVISVTDTRRATWGGYGHCITDKGDCNNCPLTGPRTPRRLPDDDELFFRIDVRYQPYLMNRPDRGWRERAEQWTWTELANSVVHGRWDVGPLKEDEHSQYFLLTRIKPSQIYKNNGL